MTPRLDGERPVGPSAAARPRRLRGDRGTTFVAAMVVMFTVTGAAAVYLARDVNQRVSDRSALQSIAFQSARAGAQQIEISGLRSDTVTVVAIDTPAAERAARLVAIRLADRYELDVRIERQFASDDRRSWTVVVTDSTGELRAIGVARAETGG
jgi:Tfp pilus assembly protein PilX